MLGDVLYNIQNEWLNTETKSLSKYYFFKLFTVVLSNENALDVELRQTSSLPLVAVTASDKHHRNRAAQLYKRRNACRLMVLLSRQMYVTQQNRVTFFSIFMVVYSPTTQQWADEFDHT